MSTYTLAEIADAVPETDEPALCPCGRGYIGHADDDRLGHRCEYHPGAVERLDFRKARQLYADHWRRVTRWCQRTGSCVICGRACHSFTDGEDDPRGPLGNHSDQSLRAEDYDDIRTGQPFPATLPDVVACFLCMNEYETSREAERIAVRRWRKATPEAGR